MNYLKLVFEKRPFADFSGEGFVDSALVHVLFERLYGLHTCLFESVQDKKNSEPGRFSVIGYDPFGLVESEKGITSLQVLRPFGEWKKSGKKIIEGEALLVLRKLMKEFSLKAVSGLGDIPFDGGMMGYFSYDFGVSLFGLEQKVFDDLLVPDFVFGIYDKVIIFDHEEQQMYLVAIDVNEVRAKEKLEVIKQEVHRPNRLFSVGKIGELQSNLTEKQYSEKISAIHGLLTDGETYQVNFSQRFVADSTQHPWLVYKSLAKSNPAPYSCYFEIDNGAIISSSPELLVEKRGNMLQTKPIKGTIARGKNAAEDARNGEKLLASEKDTAELTMIIDLERNDLGRVCEPGTVKVIHERALEKYARVIHTVATIEGKLISSKDFFDVVRAIFPGGSITGCPKKRTIEIIDELEDFKRGVYCGSAGFISFSGNASFNILIRTMFAQKGKIYLHAGGGIVIDSVADDEYQETLQKALALREALVNL